MKSILTIATTTLGLALLAPTAQAAIISGVTASTTMGATGSFNLINTINGAGLPSNTPALSGNHAAGTATNTWLSDFQSPLTGTITFDLGGSYDLDGFSFWNFNSLAIFGIRGVTVQSSTDGSSFSTIPGAPTEFAIGVQGSVSPQVFSFSPVTASHVRFAVSSNWGAAARTGFAEVQFSAAAPAPVPEPTGIVGLLAVGGIFLTTKRRRV